VHDTFGNCVAIAKSRDRKSNELRFESNMWLDHSPSTRPDFQIEDTAKVYSFSDDAAEIPDLMPTLTPHYPDPDQSLLDRGTAFARFGSAVCNRLPVPAWS
jgi:hypothetical protein